MRSILVCPVAFNENIKLQKTIERFLNSAAARQADFLVVDDGSTDGTTEMVQGFQPRGVQTIRHPQRRGVGAAIRTAIRHAVDKGYEVIVIMAGNNKDNPDEIPRLTAPILDQGYDLVQGSRYLEGERTGGAMPFYRKVATRLHPLLFSWISGTKVTDSTNGFRAIRLAVAKDPRINLDQDWLDAYELEPYLLYQTIKLGYRFKEAAVTKIYPPRKLGYTKMQPLIGWWSILRPLIYLGLGIRK